MIVQKKSPGLKIFFWLLVALAVIWACFPIAWMILTAFRSTKDFFAAEISILPQQITLENFEDVINRSGFLVYMKNSLVVGVCVTLLSIVISTMGAFAITRLDFPGRVFMARSIIASYLIPPALLFIPLFFLVTTVRLNDSIISLIITYLSATVPFSTWMLYGYFSTIPQSLDDAATIDGCNKVQVLTKVLIPLSLPGISVVALYSFTLCWNEFLYALVFITNEASRTIPAGIVVWIVEDSFAWGRLMAASTLSVIPTFLVYFVAQRSITGGLVAGAVKQ